MSISLPTQSQWFSVVKNAVIAGVAAFAVALQVNGISQPGVKAAGVAAVVAALKIVEKLLTNPTLG